MRGTLVVLLACCTAMCGCLTPTVTVDRDELEDVLQDVGVARREFDPQDPLLQRRVVLVDGRFSLPSAHRVCQELVYLDDRSTEEPIKLLINSEGGDGRAYLSIRNAIQGIEAPVDTVNFGLCGSCAALLVQSATGTRYAVEGSVFMLHQPKGHPDDLVSVFREHQEEVLRSRCRLPEEWLPLRGRTFTFSAEEALEYEFVDAVLPGIDL